MFFENPESLSRYFLLLVLFPFIPVSLEIVLLFFGPIAMMLSIAGIIAYPTDQIRRQQARQRIAHRGVSRSRQTKALEYYVKQGVRNKK